MWAYKIKCTCFENNFLSFTVSKITEKGELTITLGYWRNLQALELVCFKDIKLNISVKCKLYVKT